MTTLPDELLEEKRQLENTKVIPEEPIALLGRDPVKWAQETRDKTQEASSHRKTQQRKNIILRISKPHYRTIHLHRKTKQSWASI